MTANLKSGSSLRVSWAALAALFAGCHPAPAATRTADASSTDGDADVAVAREADAAAPTPATYRPYPHGGLTMFIAASLHTLDLPDGNRTRSQSLQHDLDASTAPLGAAERSLVSTLADGIAAGKVDGPATDAALARFRSVADSSRGSSVEAINRLHASLTPAERLVLTDDMEARWQAWQSANSTSPLGVGAGAGEPGVMGRLERLAGGEFGLTSRQLERIRAELRAPPGTLPDEPDSRLVSDLAARLKVFRTTFVGDSFDAGSLTSGGDADAATAGSVRMARFFEVAAPVLTPAQRTELSAHLRDRYGNFEVPHAITTPDPFGYFETP
jgi:Spy/CpxP family protein refolding chaperone